MISYGKLKANEEFTKGTKPNFSISTSSFLPIHKSIHTEIRVLDGKGNYYLLFKRFKCLYTFSGIKKNQG
jgi:hypothetical protein